MPAKVAWLVLLLNDQHQSSHYSFNVVLNNKKEESCCERLAKQQVSFSSLTNKPKLFSNTFVLVIDMPLTYSI